MKLLLTGAGGQLGRELKRSLAGLGEIIALRRDQLDLAAPDALRSATRTIAPDIIINAAAYTDVDRAESESIQADAVNARAPEVLADEARHLGAMLVHFSTDFVFDGSSPTAYTEDDTPAPLSAYGRSKLAGERAIAAGNCHHLILRTAWLYGLHGDNFLTSLLRLARERTELPVVTDQFGSPTWTRHLADCVAMSLSRRERVEGLFHLTAGGETSRFGFAEATFAQAELRGILPAAPLLRRIASADFPSPARRPANSRLDCTRFYKEAGLSLPDWRIGLTDCLDDMRFTA